MERKQRELREAKRQEEDILAEAERRRREMSTGSGETPPPLPSVPPPSETPPPPPPPPAAVPPTSSSSSTSSSQPDSAGQRLDMLVGTGKLNGGTPTKKVSFVTETNGGSGVDDDDFDFDVEDLDQGREGNDRADRLERAKQDPNVSLRSYPVGNAGVCMYVCVFRRFAGYEFTNIWCRRISLAFVLYNVSFSEASIINRDCCVA